MSLVPKRYTITAALPYTNGPVHIGHLAGVYVPADIYTRFLRLKGRDVAFICGSDEHGVAISIKAKKEGAEIAPHPSYADIIMMSRELLNPSPPPQEQPMEGQPQQEQPQQEMI